MYIHTYIYICNMSMYMCIATAHIASASQQERERERDTESKTERRVYRGFEREHSVSTKQQLTLNPIINPKRSYRDRPHVYIDISVPQDVVFLGPNKGS